MFDRVPPQVWLLIAIAVVAYLPAQYIYKFIAHSPSRRDITQPSEDVSWRTPGQLARNMTVVVVLVALAVLIFTPAAAQFARSPSFLPILLGCAGAWALFTVPTGLVNGKIEPFIRGINNTYERKAQPKRFWASLAWNTVFGGLCIWLAFKSYQDASAQAIQDQCYIQHTVYSPQENLSACNKLIGQRDNGGDDLADLAEAHLYRGLIFLDTGKFDDAVADFTRAHELQPKSPWPLANRGITYAWKKDQARAEKDFKAVRAIDPSNPVVLRGEALLSMHVGDMKAAVHHLTAALKRDRKNAWSLRMRAEAYRQLGEHEKSHADADELWRQSKDKNRAQPPSK